MSLVDFLMCKFSTICLIMECMLINLQFPSILKISKSFTSREIGNYIFPYFYYSSLVSIIPVYFFLTCFDTAISKSIVTIASLVLNLITLFMPKRCFYLAKSIYFLGGVSELLKSLLIKLEIHADKNDKNTSEKLLKIKFLKKLAAALCAWIGQDIYSYTNSFAFIYFYTFITNFFVILCAFYQFLSKNSNGSSIAVFEISVKSIIENLMKIKDKLLVMLLLNVLNDSISLFISINNGNFILEIQESDEVTTHSKTHSNEQKGLRYTLEKVIDISTEFVVNIISNVVRILSFLMIVIANFFFTLFNRRQCEIDYKNFQKSKKVSGVGYINGSLKVFGSSVAFCVQKYLLHDKNYHYLFCLIFYPGLVLLLGIYSSAKSIKQIKFCFFFLSIVTGIIYGLLISGINSLIIKTTDIGNKNDFFRFLFCFSMFLQNLYNTCINYFSSLYNVKTSTKIKIYCVVMTVIYSISLVYHFVIIRK